MLADPLSRDIIEKLVVQKHEEKIGVIRRIKTKIRSPKEVCLLAFAQAPYNAENTQADQPRNILQAIQWSGMQLMFVSGCAAYLLEYLREYSRIIVCEALTCSN